MKSFLKTSGRPRAAIFMSGSGSNAERLLESVFSGKVASWIPAVIFTDAPAKSRAAEIAAKYKLHLESLDIKKFYADRGEGRVSIMTGNGQRIREEWTDEVRRLLKPCGIDFGILAGFVPLTNIIRDFPCLNVHPGDLTVEENGRRILAGLHTIPIETAILKGFRTLRSSVIVAQPYTGAGGEMDTGPILGVSAPVEIDFQGGDICELRNIAAARPAQRPPGGFKDALEALAAHNQNILKEKGDWTVFPPAVDDFASGRFAADPEGRLCYCKGGNEWRTIKTVVYGADGANPQFLNHNTSC